MKVYVEGDDEYPVVYAMPTKVHDYVTEIEMTEDEYKEYSEAVDAYSKWQDELRKRINYGN